MRRRRHDNPHAERSIVEHALPGWRSRADIEKERLAIEAVEREKAELERKRARAAELVVEARRARRAADDARAAADTPDARQRAAELGAEALQAERAARIGAALVPVPWDDLSPAELRWRWELAHHHSSEDEWRPRSVFAQWAHAARERWKQRQIEVATATCEPRTCADPARCAGDCLRGADH